MVVEHLRRGEGRVGKSQVAAVFVDVLDLGADCFFAELVIDFGIGTGEGAQVGIDEEGAFGGRNAKPQGPRSFFIEVLHIQ